MTDGAGEQNSLPRRRASFVRAQKRRTEVRLVIRKDVRARLSDDRGS